MLQQNEKETIPTSPPPPPYRGRDDSREYGLEYDDGQELPMPATAADRAASRRWIVQMVLVGVAVYYIITSYGRAAMSINWMHHGCSHHRFPLPSDGQVDMSHAPVGKLVEHECWKDLNLSSPFTCYRMSAPLDYTNKSDHRRADVALVKYPAGGGKTPSDKKLGSIFFNPGGPGGSGISFLTAFSPSRGGNISTAAWFDKIFEGRYDLLSFDPRGVGKTKPLANCFLDDNDGAYANEIFYEGGGLPHSSDHAVVKSIAHDNLIAGVCKKNKGEELRHVSTYAVVHDMSLMRKAVGDKYLNYAGFSYGTVLGSYFADILPGEVGKMWLDGVVDVPNYQQGSWSDNLVDFEKVLEGFFTTCADAGEKHCPLATILTDEQRKRSDKGAEILRDTTFDMLESLKDQPVAVANAKLPQMSTYIGLKSAIFSSMYAPSKWANFTKLLVAAKEGNWAPLVETSGLTRLPHKPAVTPANNQAQNAIMCSDALQFDENWNKADYERFLVELEKTSPFAGELWIGDGAMCMSAWSIRADYAWPGSFNSTPAHPILFGSNDYDPVTPLFAARKMRDSFGGDNKLFRIEKGYGHCTVALPTRCGMETVADWFVRGKLPEEKEKVCKLDAPPYMPQPKVPDFATLSEEERVKVEAVEAMEAVGEIMAEWRQTEGRRFKL